MLRVEAARAIAIQRHVKRGECEIDPDCDASAVPTGIWIAAWIFVSSKDINDAMEMDQCST
jgi:hypothetical protein